MSVWQNLANWLRGPDGETYTIERASAEERAEKILNFKFLMMQSALGYLSSCLAMCRWRTIVGGEEEFGTTYAQLNNHPNPNQTKMEFCAKLVYKLAMENEALVFTPNKRDLYVADNFNVEERGTKLNLYRDVSVDDDTRAFDFDAEHVMHMKMSWVGLWPLISAVADEYEEIINTAYTGYRRQTGQRGVLTIQGNASGTPEQRKAEAENIRQRFKKFYETTSGVLTLNAGYKYEHIASSARNTSELNDVANLTDEFAERLGLALRVPVALLKGNVENTSNARKDLVMFGVRPIAQMVEQAYNNVEDVAKGTRLFIDPLSIQIGDIENLPSFCERMTSCGQYSIDELRDLRGEPLLGTPEAQEHYITKNYGILGAEEQTGIVQTEVSEGGDEE